MKYTNISIIYLCSECYKGKIRPQLITFDLINPFFVTQLGLFYLIQNGEHINILYTKYLFFKEKTVHVSVAFFTDFSTRPLQIQTIEMIQSKDICFLGS